MYICRNWRNLFYLPFFAVCFNFMFRLSIKRVPCVRIFFGFLFHRGSTYSSIKVKLWTVNSINARTTLSVPTCDYGLLFRSIMQNRITEFAFNLFYFRYKILRSGWMVKAVRNVVHLGYTVSWVMSSVQYIIHKILNNFWNINWRNIFFLSFYALTAL